MNKEFILDEIRRLAQTNGGVALGRDRFERETGIRESKWLGVYWAKWSDAIIEAGLSPRTFNTAHPDQLILSKLAGLVRKLGRFPTNAEIRLEKRIDPAFPWHNSVARLGDKASLIAFLAQFCQENGDFRDVSSLLRPLSENASLITSGPKPSKATIGVVYLVQGGKFYKIGFTNDIGRRTYDLRIQLPEKVKLIHQIETDDPKGIEQYWHRRFADRHANGEWFALTPEDVAAFKRRKSM